MLLAMVGILLIVAFLGLAAFLVGKEHEEAMRRDEEILGSHLPSVHWHPRAH